MNAWRKRGLTNRSIEVIGQDLATKKYLARSFVDQGASEIFEVALKGKTWRNVGESARFNGKFDASGNKLTGLWQLKGKKSGWQPWIQPKLVRA